MSPFIHLQSGYYASLCFYGLQKIGFMNSKKDPHYKKWADQLSELGEAFRFNAPLAGGPLFSLVYQVPGYLDPQSLQDLQEVFQATDKFIVDRDIAVFKKQFPFKTLHWEKWYTEAWLNNIFAGMAHDIPAARKAVKLFFEFMKEMWLSYPEAHAEKTSRYPFAQRELLANKLNVFDRWQQQLEQPYPYSSFKVIICPQSETFASSLGPEKIVFGAKHSWPVLENALTHEIGVRTANLEILAKHPETGPFMKANYFGMLKIIETEICYRKKNLLPSDSKDPFVKSMGLEKLMAWRQQQNVNCGFPSLLAKLYTAAHANSLL